MSKPNIAPLAKQLAEENNVDWQTIQGSGPAGRIVEKDVLTYLARVMAGDEDLNPTAEPVPEGMGAWPEEDVKSFGSQALAPTEPEPAPAEPEFELEIDLAPAEPEPAPTPEAEAAWPTVESLSAERVEAEPVKAQPSGTEPVQEGVRQGAHDALEAKCEALETEVQTLRAKLASAGEELKELPSLRERVATQGTQLTELGSARDEAADLKRKIERLSSLREEKAQLETSFKKAQGELKHAQKRVKELEAQVQELSQKNPGGSSGANHSGSGEASAC